MRQNTLHPSPNIKSLIVQRIDQAPVDTVWTPVDFLDLGGRAAVDKTLQRMAASGAWIQQWIRKLLATSINKGKNHDADV